MQRLVRQAVSNRESLDNGALLKLLRLITGDSVIADTFVVELRDLLHDSAIPAGSKALAVEALDIAGIQCPSIVIPKVLGDEAFSAELRQLADAIGKNATTPPSKLAEVVPVNYAKGSPNDVLQLVRAARNLFRHWSALLADAEYPQAWTKLLLTLPTKPDFSPSGSLSCVSMNMSPVKSFESTPNRGNVLTGLRREDQFINAAPPASPLQDIRPHVDTASLLQEAQSAVELMSDALRRAQWPESRKMLAELAAECGRIQTQLTAAMGTAAENNDFELFDRLQKAEALLATECSAWSSWEERQSKQSPAAAVPVSPPAGPTSSPAKKPSNPSPPTKGREGRRGKKGVSDRGNPIMDLFQELESESAGTGRRKDNATTSPTRYDLQQTSGGDKPKPPQGIDTANLAWRPQFADLSPAVERPVTDQRTSSGPHWIGVASSPSPDTRHRMTKQTSSQWTESNQKAGSNHRFGAASLNLQQSQEPPTAPHDTAAAALLAQAQLQLAESHRDVKALSQALHALTDSEKELKADLADVSRDLARAKEMWLRESARASALSQTVEDLEAKLVAKESAYLQLSKKHYELLRELSAFKQLVKLDTGSEHAFKFLQDSGIIEEVTTTLQSSPSQSIASPVVVHQATSAVGQVVSGKSMNPLFPPSSVQNLPKSFAGTKKRVDENAVPCSLTPLKRDGAAALNNFKSLIWTDSGTLFEDSTIHIGVKCERKDVTATVDIFYGNMTASMLTQFQVDILVDGFSSHCLFVQCSPLVSDQLLPRQQLRQTLAVACTDIFLKPPKLTVQYLLPDSSPVLLVLPLPIVVTKFMAAEPVSFEDYRKYWTEFQLSEVVTAVILDTTLYRGSSLAVARALQFDGALKLLAGYDPDDNTLVFAGVFPPPESGTGVPTSLALVRLELVAHKETCRVFVRSDSELLARSLRDLVLLCLSPPATELLETLVTRGDGRADTSRAYLHPQSGGVARPVTQWPMSRKAG